MSITKLNIEDFLEIRKNHPILDVRSPGEYTHAHIPGAFSFPIFSNDERKIIGTAYKQESREKAIKLGLDFFGKNMVRIVEEAEKINSSAKNASREIGVHCWRGGMRSSAMAWLLDLYGFNVSLLSGGYKAYRHWVLQQFDKNYSLRVVGGCTGGNKTGMIHELEKCGEAVIDLEGIAVHKGSAFGNLDRFEQPSQEHFENLLAEELHQKSQGGRTIWLEGESQRLGLINIPLAFHMNMRREPLFFMDIPFPLRLEHILTGYGRYNKEYLISAILRIKKKLGGLETKNAINALLEDDVPGCFAILLKYYDKLYTRAIQTKEEGGRETITIVSDSTNPILNTEKLIQHVRNRN